MPRRLPNPRLVKLHRSYTVEEVAERLSVHENTVRRWVKDGGLPTVDDGRPTLIAGGELREFLVRGRSAKRRPCGPGRFYCLRCREPQRPAEGMVDFVPSPNSTSSGQLQALCPSCDGLMQRRASRERAAAAMPGIDIHYRAQKST